jgi:hypothetical protein
MSISEASELLVNKGISRGPFHPESVISAAADCNLPTSLEIQTISGKEFVNSKIDEGVSKRLASIARKQSGGSGATDVAEVIEQARDEGLDFEDETVVKLIRCLPGAAWLADDWFWFPSGPVGRNRLRNVARKMLSVTSPIHAKKIRVGMRKVTFYRNSTSPSKQRHRVPPTAVILKFFEQHPEFKVDADGLVHKDQDLDYKAVLGDTEQALVEALRSTPTSVLDRQSIRDECMSKGLRTDTIEQLITYSPLLEHLGTNLWSIAGAIVDPASVEAVREANALRPKKRRVTNFGWTETGDIWVSVAVPSYLSGSFVFGVPGGVKKYLTGHRFVARDDSGREYGNVTVADGGNVHGAGRLLLRKGADAGDVMLCRFNLAENTVLITVGGDELTEEL